MTVAVVSGVLTVLLTLFATNYFKERHHILIDGGVDETPLSGSSVSGSSEELFPHSVMVFNDGDLPLRNIEVSISFGEEDTSKPFRIEGPSIMSKPDVLQDAGKYNDMWEADHIYEMRIKRLNPDEGYDLNFYGTQRSNIEIEGRTKELSFQKYVPLD